MRPTVDLLTLGCRLNQAETDEVLFALGEHGLQVDRTDPNVVVVNTCTVTSEASSASRKLIRRAIREHPEATVFVTGCYAVADPDALAAIPGVDVVIAEKAKIADQVARRLGLGSQTPVIPTFPSPRRNLRVQTGCDEQCTFCIVPTTRGDLSSSEPAEVVGRARRLVEAGVTELTLSGVHLGKYGHDVGSSRSLIALLEELLAIDGLLRVRLSSIEASQVDDELLDLIAEEPKLARYLHLPLQTGSRRVWESMRRPGSLDRFLDVAAMVRSRVPGIAITTDVMVGFPGEDAAAFQETLQVVETVGFEKLHVFRFSPRVGTPAASAAGQVNPKVARERSHVVRDLGRDIRRKWVGRYAGRYVEVLVEKAGRTVEAEGGRPALWGYTDTYARVRTSGPAGLVGRLVTVLVGSVGEDLLEGEIVEGLPVLPDRRRIDSGRHRR